MSWSPWTDEPFHKGLVSSFLTSNSSLAFRCLTVNLPPTIMVDEEVELEDCGGIGMFRPQNGGSIPVDVHLGTSGSLWTRFTHMVTPLDNFIRARWPAIEYDCQTAKLPTALQSGCPLQLSSGTVMN